MTQIHELTALEIAAAYRSGELAPSEAVEHFLGRIDEANARLGAFVTLTADAAREAAAAADARVADARRTGAELPLLFGVPTGIKDLNSTKGVRTTFGSVIYADYVPTFSDEVVLRMERAGMISLGKTNAPEFGAPCYTEPHPSIAPPARSPYDLALSAGGSSGGSAAAVAAGLVPIAQGSDGGGSIRIPASVTGLVGFKPSRGRISKSPNYGDITGLSTAGPLARTVRDSAALLDALAGPAVGDPTWAAPLPDGETYLSWCDRATGPLRIARWSDPAIASPVDAEVAAAFEQATDVLRKLGHEVVDIASPVPSNMMDVFRVVWDVSAALAPLPDGAEARLQPLTAWLRARGTGVSAAQFGAAMGRLQQVSAGIVRAISEYDAVLTPTLARVPAAVGAIRNDADPAADFAAQVEFTPFTAVWNTTGMPAVSLPVGWTTGSGDAGAGGAAGQADGATDGGVAGGAGATTAGGVGGTHAPWPIGAMLAGRPGEDHRLYALAAAVEAECSDPGNPWRRPTLPGF